MDFMDGGVIVQKKRQDFVEVYKNQALEQKRTFAFFDIIVGNFNITQKEKYT